MEKRIIYLVNQYPAVTHTFIRREILALERIGARITRVAVRAGMALVDPLDFAEKDKTVFLLQSRSKLVLGVMQAMIGWPMGFAKALCSALGLMRRSDRPAAVHLFYLAEACSLALIARRCGARHIHAHFGTNPAEVALLAAQICGITYSFTVHGCDEYDKPEFLALPLKMRHASFVAAVSHYGRAQLLRWCDKPDQGKIHLIRCGLEAGYGAEDTDIALVPRLVCVGRLCREKAQVTLLHATAQLVRAGQRFELVLVGDGDMRADLEALVQELDLSTTVQMTGWLTGPEVKDEIRRARALIVSSFAENLPVVIMEAMALGRPVVATCIAGIPELVVAGETGWLVPASCITGLAKAMRDCLAASAVQMAALGQRGREMVQLQHDCDVEAAKLLQLFPRTSALLGQ